MVFRENFDIFGVQTENGIFLRPFLVFKTRPQRAKAHYAPSLFWAAFSAPKMDAFFARPFVQRWLFWSLGSSHPGVVPHNSAHPWRTMYGFPRAPSPAHCHAKAALGGVQNRRAVIAAVALDRPPPRRGAVRLRRGGMRAARGAAPKTPR